MPRTLTFPAPSPQVCPVCDDRLVAHPCAQCGADLASPAGRDLWVVDHRIHELTQVRERLVHLLLAPAGGSAVAAPSAPGVPASAGDPAVTPGPAGDDVATPWTAPGVAAPPASGGGTAAWAPPPGRSWSAPEVLVALGALSLVAAVAVFTAVTWDRLAAAAQGALLVTLTAVVVGVAAYCRRRGLVATAEALGAVGVALGLADVHVARVALDGAVTGRVVTAAGLAVLAGACVGGGRLTGLRSLTAAGAGLAFVPVPLLVVTSPSVLALAVALAATALVAVGLDRLLDGWTFERAVVRLGGTISWAIAGLVALGAGAVGLAADPVRGPAGSSAVLVALAAVAVVAVVVPLWTRSTRGLVLVAGTGAVLAAVGLGAAGVTEAIEVWLAVMALAGGALVAAGAGAARLDADRPWAAVAGTGVAAVVVGSTWALAQVLGTAVALLESLGTWGDGDAGTRVLVRLGEDRSFLPDGLGLAHIVAVLAVGAVAWARGSSAGRAVTAVAAGALALCAPVALDLTVGVTVAGLLPLVLAGAAVMVVRGGVDAWLQVLLVGLAALVVAVAMASVALVVGVSVAVAAAGLAVAAAMVARGEAGAERWLGSSLAVLLATVAFDAVVLGHGQGAVMISLALTAVLVAGVGPVVERLRPEQSEVAGAADLVAGVGLVVAGLGAPSVDVASAVVALAGVVAGLSTLRPSRRWAWLVSVGAAVLLTWVRLGDAGVVVPEAYALPLAAGLLLVGVLVRRDEEADGSWRRFGPGLAVALGPSTVLALALDDVGRTVAVVAAGVAVTVWGAAGRAQAPLALGATAVGAVALRHLAPVAAELPRYLVFAAAGVVLVAVGATFEQRRSDLRSAREAFARLR